MQLRQVGTRGLGGEGVHSQQPQLVLEHTGHRDKGVSIVSNPYELGYGGNESGAVNGQWFRGVRMSTCNVALVVSARMGLMAFLSPRDVSTMDSSISNSTATPRYKPQSPPQILCLTSCGLAGHPFHAGLGPARVTLISAQSEPTWDLPRCDRAEDGLENVGVHLEQLLTLQQLGQAVDGRQETLGAIDTRDHQHEYTERGRGPSTCNGKDWED